MRTKSTKAAIAVKKADGHGRHIFIYNNLLTNQVIYSLTQSMQNNHALKQLAYFGKKSVPATLRKDVWAPLISVTFPRNNQGLDAFRKLREYRRIRDVTWDKDAEGMPLEKKRRKKALMNQKAASIADLAAILHKQEIIGRETAAKAEQVREEQQAKAAEEQRQVESELRELAKRAQNGEPAELEAKIEDLTAHMLGQKFPNQPSPGERRKENIAKQILRLRQLRNSIKRADETVQDGSVSEVAKNRVERRRISRALSGQEPKQILHDQDLIKGSWPPPHFGRRRILSLPKKVNYYTSEGVKVAWSNVMDAEFAESWPEAVQHTHMGITRHTAANPDLPPRMEPKVRHRSPMHEAEVEGRKEEIKQSKREAAEEEKKANAATDNEPGWNLVRRLRARLSP
ncbi:hypothetical protein EV356DRAFT_572864 [Viridothelium virens]|uniref:Large ribosomal subunit protein mL67 n=1 Tax=Viridothelium virens TaxID=1048519 RepID=A0A6A6HLS2_VIRVR|nr:hypothetical protein EV356DRAFT_572864 [Viridothelium virens]